MKLSRNNLFIYLFMLPEVFAFYQNNFLLLKLFDITFYYIYIIFLFSWLAFHKFSETSMRFTLKIDSDIRDSYVRDSGVLYGFIGPN